MLGSGVIVQKDGTAYTVVTNRHVANRGNKYQIQTANNLIHTGKFLAVAEENDLALLRFTCDRFYSVAVINSTSL